MDNKPSMNTDQLLRQIGEILEMIQNPKGPISQNITPEVLANLTELEAGVQFINQLNEWTVESVGPENLKKNIEESIADSKEKQLIERADNIVKDARTLQLVLSKAIHRGKRRKKEKRSPEANSKQAIKERRKLFKSLGGDSKWIPL